MASLTPTPPPHPNRSAIPSESVQSITAVTSHPQVADTWAVLPTLDSVPYKYCTDYRNGIGAGFPTFDLDCDYPWPLVVQGSASGFTVAPTRGPATMFGSPMTSYPSGRVSSATWSEIGVKDDSADGTGSYLVVGTLGQGTWRGELTW